MTLNPIRFAQDVNSQFLRYQLTAFPMSDPDLAEQAKKMLTGSGRESPLVKGPYLSLSRSYQEGKSLKQLVDEKMIHPAVEGVAEYPVLFAHQQDTLEAVKREKSPLITSGTGSGKTEAFLYPILDHCFKLRDENAPPGIVAVIVYPMNALAIDQLGRLRRMLAGTGITFGMYIGNTPRDWNEISNVKRMQKGEGRDKIPEYDRRYSEHKNFTTIPYEERHTEKEINEEPPRILLTNANQLELLVTRASDQGIFQNAPLKFLVFDEAHTYSGATGAEVATLIRRLRAFCNKTRKDVICIGTSATITDPVLGERAGIKFASRFFGVRPEDIELVSERYSQEKWSSNLINPDPVGKEAETLFSETLEALKNSGNPEKISSIIYKLSRYVFDPAMPWKESLYKALEMNQVVKTTFEVLNEPMEFQKAVKTIWQKLGRFNPITQNNEYELLTYLTLGAAAEKNGNPLLRPKLHYFVRGLGGAAAVFHKGDTETLAELFFSHEKALEKHKEIMPTGVFSVMVCKNCGQHYFETWLEGIDPEITGLTGGLAEGDNVYWPVKDASDKDRIVFTNRFVSEIEEDDNQTERLDQKRQEAFICSHCGSFHQHSASVCSNPNCKRNTDLLGVYILTNTENGKATNCPSCGQKGQKGTRFSEPFRPLTAVIVADVHILAQNMINAETISQRKLITFADNRQDAAFQAAWMADHARRYRLRQLMYLQIEGNTEPISIGDLQQKLLNYLKSNSELARTLIPEVYAGEIEEAYSSKIDEQLKKFLRISILREFVTGFRRRDSLETWGVARVDYYGLNEDDIKIKELSAKYSISSKTLVIGIETLLDHYRRTRFLYDEAEPIYSHYWHYGDIEVQRGYLPFMDFPPKGLKYYKEDGDKTIFVSGFFSVKGQTLARNFINKWGIADDKIQDLIRDIWSALSKDWNIITSVTLKSNKGTPLGGATGVFQIDSRKMGIVKQHERYTCKICHRVHTRDTPNHSCSRIHCNGTLQREEPPADDYSISLLKHDFKMLVAREHTAQVPAKIREALEDDFKKPTGKVNCLVATPTLELGVDIGDLDIILMRNMPPLSSNYWQRAGRAGRRHRMAAIYTYCRNNAHDEYFFDDPYRILSGRIYPPKFNMRNNVMIRKHVHATVISVLTRISQLKKPFPGDTLQDLENLRITLNTVFPSFISEYLFESDSTYKKTPLDVSPLNKAIERYKAQIEKEVIQVFTDCWPKDSEMEVKPEVLTGYMNTMYSALQERIDLLHTRLMWTINTRNKILEKEKTGRLEEIEERLLKRCREYLKTLTHKDLNTYTLTVLAREGFLPGYGTYEGNITAFAGTAYTSSWHKMAFELTRSPAIAVREFIPGNLIYANGGKYRTVLLHLPFSEERITPDEYILDVESQRIVEKGVPTSGYSGEEQPATISGLPICDVDIGFISHVSDEESNRYKLPVYIAGYLQSFNRGGISYSCGGNEFDHLIGQGVRLVNVGPSNRVTDEKYGYPVCTVCGGTRSPFASEKEIENFKNYHTKSCGKEPGWYAITSDATVDGILFKKLTSQEDAINLAEAIRIGANQTLEMKQEDLQILILPQGAEEWDVFIFDHMAGGSGLLNQLIERWKEIIVSAKTVLLKCSNSCEKSCYVCMRSFFNMYYHELLDRKCAIDLLIKYDHPPQKQHDITPKAREERSSGQSTNLGESRLRQILLDHGFPEFDAQTPISIPHSKYKTTTPDLLRVDPVTGAKVAVYLDGLSKGIHGNQERQQIDSIIRAILRSQGYHVEEISTATLDDPEVLGYHLKSIANVLNLKIDKI